MGKLYLALGYACNHKCISCPIQFDMRQNGFLSLSEVKGFLSDAAPTKEYDYVELSGGEPTLHPQFWDIVEHITVTAGLRCSILTNSDLLAKPAEMERLLRYAGKIHITTAIYASNSELHDKVTQSIGSWERSVRALTASMAFGVPITIKQIIQKSNAEDLLSWYCKCRELFPNSHLALHAMDFCGQAKENGGHTAVSFREIAPFLEDALDMAQTRSDSRLVLHSIPFCAIDPAFWSFVSAKSRQASVAYRDPKVQMVNDGVQKSGIDTNTCRRCVLCDNCPGTWYSHFEAFPEDTELTPLTQKSDS